MDKLVETRRERFWYPEAWARDQWIRAEAAKIPPGSRVLDAGAGASKYRPIFAHCRYETQDFCRYQGPLVEYVEAIDHVCDITGIPLSDAALDAILCTEVLEHVPNPIAVLKEFSRLLKPNGKLLLTAPEICDLHMTPYHYYIGFTHYWYRHWLPEFGFAIDSIQSQSGPSRTAVRALQGVYGYWRSRELELRGVKRLLSLGGRMLVKAPVFYLLPRLLSNGAPHFDPERVSTGLMVAATRVAQKL